MNKNNNSKQIESKHREFKGLLSKISSTVDTLVDSSSQAWKIFKLENIILYQRQTISSYKAQSPQPYQPLVFLI